MAAMRKRGSKVFLSYARRDREPAQKIGDRLRKAGFDVWDPDREILPGANFGAEINSALQSADALVVLISPEAMRSRDVSYEIEYALTAEHLRGRLIPVVLHPAKDAPWILNRFESIRYESPTRAGDQIAELLNRPAHVPQTRSPA